jgi:hypothetical protein
MFGLLGDIVKIVAAPVVIAESVVRVVTKPVADIATEVAEEVSSAIKDAIE